MKKTLLALTLLASSIGAAHAQSVVVLSGQLDLAIGAEHLMVQWPFAEPYNDIRGRMPKKNSDAPILYQERELGLVNSPNGGSNLHFYAAEDFNNGLIAYAEGQADFDYQGEMTNPTFWGSQLVVGLKGDNFGTMTFGRQQSISGQMNLNPFNTFNIRGMDAMGDIAGTTNDATLAYMTPNVSGFQFGVSYDGRIFEVYKTESKSWGSEDAAYNHFSAGLSYTGDIFSAAVTFDQLNTKEHDAQKIKPARAATVGMMLTFPRVQAYYRFGYAARGFDNSIGQYLYIKGGFRPLTPHGTQMAPTALNGLSQPFYDIEDSHRYVNELGMILKLTDRSELRIADQFEYVKQPKASKDGVKIQVPKFVKGSTKEGKINWYNTHDSDTKVPEYVWNGDYADNGILKVFTNVLKVAYIYHLFLRADVYAFADYGYTSSKLDVGNKDIRTDVSRAHYVYSGVGFTLKF